MHHLLAKLASLTAMAADADPVVKPTPAEVRTLSGHGFAVLMWMSLFVVALLCIALWILIRRLRALESARRRIGTTHTPVVSAWEEAGKRAAPLPVEDLERQGETPRTPVATPLAGASASPAGQAQRPIAMVTGAARRVGRAIALELARAGCDVLVTYRTNAADAESLARELAAIGAQATLYRVDLADTREVEQFADQLAQTLPRLDILVHNASMYEPSPIGEDGSRLDAALLSSQFHVNAFAPLILTAQLRSVLARSILPGGASVVAMGDIHAMGRPRPAYAAYAMSKAALLEMVHSLARDLAPVIRVNALAPGVVAWQEREDPGTTSEAEQAKYLRRIPLARFGTPEDAAKAVRWLSLEATYVTGQVLRIDGGRWLT